MKIFTFEQFTNESLIKESHFKVGDKVKMSHGGEGIIVSLDKEDGADDEAYYNIELPNGDMMKHAPNELEKVNEALSSEQKMVETFLKKVAKEFDYSIQDAVRFVKETISKMGLDEELDEAHSLNENKLVDETTGKEVKLPYTTKDFRGDKIVVVSFTPPKHSGSSGRILTSGGGEFFPGVAGLKIVN